MLTFTVKSFQEFYTNILVQAIPTKEKTEAEDVRGQMQTLDVADRKLIDGWITLTEMQDAITSLPNGKTPGPDGLSGEFYKQCKDVMLPLLLAVFQDA